MSETQKGEGRISNRQDFSKDGPVVASNQEGNQEGVSTIIPAGENSFASPEGSNPILDLTTGLGLLKEQVERNFKENREEIERSKNISYLGFFALAIVVAGLAYSYFEFISSTTAKDSYERDIGVKVGNYDFILGNLKSENERLRSQVDSMEKIFGCQKAKDKRYWEYQKCFE